MSRRRMPPDMLPYRRAATHYAAINPGAAVRLTTADAEDLQRWRTWFGRHIGGQPAEMVALQLGRADTVTLPCRDPSDLLPALRAVQFQPR